MANRTIGSLIGLAAVLMSVNISATPASAQVEFDLRGGDMRVYRDDDRRYYRDDRRDYGRYDRPRERDRGCSPRQALAAASRWLDEPRIRYTTRQYYVIEGYGKRGGGRGRPDGVRISTYSDCERSQ